MHQQPRRQQWPATFAVLALNAVVFIIQFVAGRFYPDYPFDERFELSLNGLKSGYFWQLLTYQFMHASFLHIFFNCWAIFIFGREVEIYLGKARMLAIYFTSGVVGGLVQMLGAWLLPNHFGVAVVGASAGAFGLVAAFAVMFPNRELFLLVFFVLPVKMRAKTLIWVSLGIAIFGIIVPFGNIGHAAHLGGILAGYLFARVLTQRYRTAPATSRLF